jgi:hypothetical protein
MEATMRQTASDHESNEWPTSLGAWLRLGAQGVIGLLLVWGWLVIVLLGFA